MNTTSVASWFTSVICLILSAVLPCFGPLCSWMATNYISLNAACPRDQQADHAQAEGTPSGYPSGVPRADVQDLSGPFYCSEVWGKRMEGG